MTEPGYLLWFVATAAMTVTVLAVGTLAAADLLPRRKHARRHNRRRHSEARTRANGPDTFRSTALPVARAASWLREPRAGRCHEDQRRADAGRPGWVGLRRLTVGDARARPDPAPRRRAGCSPAPRGRGG
jgi:hypothetical protein